MRKVAFLVVVGLALVAVGLLFSRDDTGPPGPRPFSIFVYAALAGLVSLGLAVVLTARQAAQHPAALAPVVVLALMGLGLLWFGSPNFPDYLINYHPWNEVANISIVSMLLGIGLLAASVVFAVRNIWHRIRVAETI